MIFHRNKNRIIEIDFLRGVLILFMIVDHLFYDFFDILPRVFSDYEARCGWLMNLSMNYWTWEVRVGTRFAILALFFLLSGICCYFSKSNLKRGIIVFVVGGLISLGFFAFSKIIDDSSMRIIFGAISCFGTSILLYWLLRFIFNKCFSNHKYIFKWIALCLGIVVITLGMVFDVWNVKNMGPSSVTVNSFKTFMQVVIGTRQSFATADWLPLCPYFGFLLVGSFIGETLYKDKKSLLPKLPSKPNEIASTARMASYEFIILPYKGIKNAVSFTGRHSLLFYLLHQVVLILVLCLTFLAMGYKLNIQL